MILLDTNVISALMRTSVDPHVQRFVEAQDIEEIFTSAVCVAEIRYGLARLPQGRRREALADAFATFLERGLAGRVLPFDPACATFYAEARAARESAGLACAIADMLIAGTALAHGATVVTRNGSDFLGTGVPVANPWNPTTPH